MPWSQPTLPFEVTYSNREGVRFQWPLVATLAEGRWRWEIDTSEFETIDVLMEYLDRAQRVDWYFHTEIGGMGVWEVRASDEAFAAASNCLSADIDIQEERDAAIDALRLHNDDCR